MPCRGHIILDRIIVRSANDLYGDGDQAPYPDAATADDIRHRTLSNIETLYHFSNATEPLTLAMEMNAFMLNVFVEDEFHLACACGDHASVERCIEAAKPRM